MVQTLETVAQSSEGVTKTQLMYKAFLSFEQLKEYLSLLLSNNLLEYNLNSRTYKITEKGVKLIKVYNKMKEYIETLED